MIFCPQCGAANPGSDPFCASCGASLSGISRPKADPGSGGERPRFGIVGGSASDSARGGSTYGGPTHGGSAYGGSTPGGGGPRPPRRSRAPLWIALGTLGVALAVLAAIFLPRLLSGKGGSGASLTPASPAAMEPVYAAAEPYENDDGTVSEEQAQAAIDAVYQAALENPDVLSCVKDEYGVYMEVAEGPDYVYCPSIEGMDVGEGPLEIITLQPFDTENRNLDRKNGWHHDLDALDDVADALAASDSRWVFGTYNNVNDGAVTMDRILSLGDCEAILWQGHGGYTEYGGYFLCTEVTWSTDLATRYGLNKGNCVLYHSDKIGLRPQFFAENFPDGAFDNAFLYIGTCYSGKEQTLARIFLDKGAAVVFVNSESVNRGYNLNMLRLIAESFLVGPQGSTTQAAMQKLGPGYSYNTPENWTIGDSLILAQLRYGSSDPGKLINASSVYYLCRDGMEHTSRTSWMEGFGVSAAGPVTLTAQQQTELNLALSRFHRDWSIWNFDDAHYYEGRLLHYAIWHLVHTEPGSVSQVNGQYVVSLADVNRVLSDRFQTTLSPIDGQISTVDPPASEPQAEAAYLSGSFYFYPNPIIPEYPRFTVADSVTRLPDGTLSLTFTEYQIDEQWLDSSGMSLETFCTLSPGEISSYLDSGILTQWRQGSIEAVLRGGSGNRPEDYAIVRYALEWSWLPSPDAYIQAEPPVAAIIDGECTVYVEEVQNGSFRVTMLEPVWYEESYVNSLELGDWVDEGNWYAQVTEIDNWNGHNIYYLDDYCSILWSPKWQMWILCAPSDAAIMREIAEYILPVSSGLLVRDDMYAVQYGTTSQLWTLQEIMDRYGDDLSSLTFELTLTNGQVTDATIIYLP